MKDKFLGERISSKQKCLCGFKNCKSCPCIWAYSKYFKTCHLFSQELCIVVCLKDLTSIVDIKTSSRPAMIGSLTDGSTETFWESGDEDKNKTKNITINCVKGINARYVCVHVDNSRDLGVRGK